MSKTFDANSVYFDDSSNFDNSLPFDAASASVVVIKQTDSVLVDAYTAVEFGIFKSRTAFESIENYSKFVNLMEYVPDKFKGSVVLQQFITEAGLLTGEWLGNINDLSTLVDKYSVSEKYITHLADLIGFSFHTTSSSTFTDIQKQLIQAIDWYRMKGTYQAYRYIGYVLGLNLKGYDLYTEDYINFISEPWYAGDVGTLPPDPALNNPPFLTTSIDSLTIATGPQSFNVETGLTFAANQNIAILHDIDNYMTGTLTSYNSGSGEMVVEVGSVTGSGTYDSWNIPGGYYKSTHFGIQAVLDNVYNYSTNKLYNWSFEEWSTGTNNPPDGWLFTTDYSSGMQGVGGNQVVQTVGHVEIGTYAAQLVSNQIGFSSTVFQNVSSVTGVETWKNQTVTFGAWVWAPTAATETSLWIDDGVSLTRSSYHPADDNWHYLTVTKTISNTATYIRCAAQCKAVTAAITAYVDSAVFLLGSTISPIPALVSDYQGPDLWYLFDGSDTHSLLTAYVDQVRPVNTVPEYGLIVTAQTKQDRKNMFAPGYVQTAVIGVTWGSDQLFFDDGVTKVDDSKFFDFAATAFYNSISTWKLGTGNKGVNPSNVGFTLQNPVASLTGSMPDPVVFSDHIRYTITVPDNVTQDGISELGLYLGSTLEVGCTFPDINLVSGLTLVIFVDIYF